MKFGIALGGGGAKGLAHIGVLKALEEKGIKPAYISGTSIGSVIGAVYSLQDNTGDLLRQTIDFIESEEFRAFGLEQFYTYNQENLLKRFKKEVFEKFYIGSLLFKQSHVKFDAARKLFDKLFGNSQFADCKINFACNALDLASGDEVVFDRGKLGNAVWASCAIPGILPPFIDNHRFLVDGGVINNIPVAILKNIGARITIAVYLGKTPQYVSNFDTGFRITQRAMVLARFHLDQRILDTADLVIRPDIKDFHWADFSRVDELVECGYRAANDAMPEIIGILSWYYRLRKRIGLHKKK